MTELADRLREATIVLRPAYAEQLSTAIAEVGELQSLRAPELLSFARASFPCRANDTDVDVVMETFRRRSIEGDRRTRQLWSTLAGLAMINRFERGPGKRADARIAADSVAAVAVEVLANQGLEPVHPDVVTRAERWNASIAEHLRARGTIGKPADLPPELATPPSPAAANAEEPAAPDGEEAPAPAATAGFSAEQGAALVEHVHELTQWVAKSSIPARLEALEEQQALLWWLESAKSKVRGSANTASTVLHACEELISATRFFPGPPGARELLVRRLGSAATKPLSPQTLSERAAREVPTAIADVCSLLIGVQQNDEVEAIDLASQLYTEMVLVELVKGSVA